MSDKLIVRIFSDNIVVATPGDLYRSDDNNLMIALNRITTIVGTIQRLFLDNNILLRGGIAFGDFYADDLMIWGDALNKAYLFEDKIAEYPRVVVEKQLCDFFLYNKGPLCSYGVKLISDNGQTNFQHSEIMRQSYCLKQDFDGEYFIDYLNYLKDKKVKGLINNALKEVEKNKKNINYERILKKLGWHENYLLGLAKNIK